jgi:hypothetical protein
MCVSHTVFIVEVKAKNRSGWSMGPRQDVANVVSEFDSSLLTILDLLNERRHWDDLEHR